MTRGAAGLWTDGMCGPKIGILKSTLTVKSYPYSAFWAKIQALFCNFQDQNVGIFWNTYPYSAFCHFQPLQCILRMSKNPPLVPAHTRQSFCLGAPPGDIGQKWIPIRVAHFQSIPNIIPIKQLEPTDRSNRAIDQVTPLDWNDGHHYHICTSHVVSLFLFVFWFLLYSFVLNCRGSLEATMIAFFGLDDAK